MTGKDGCGDCEKQDTISRYAHSQDIQNLPVDDDNDFGDTESSTTQILFEGPISRTSWSLSHFISFQATALCVLLVVGVSFDDVTICNSCEIKHTHSPKLRLMLFIDRSSGQHATMSWRSCSLCGKRPQVPTAVRMSDSRSVQHEAVQQSAHLRKKKKLKIGYRLGDRAATSFRVDGRKQHCVTTVPLLLTSGVGLHMLQSLAKSK